MPLSSAYAAGDALPADDLNAHADYINADFFVGKMATFFSDTTGDGSPAAPVPNGWLKCTGETIGDASSNATLRANADMLALFTHLWTYNNGAIYTSGGAGSTYGASAAADFAAHKRLALPDFRLFYDSMSSRLTLIICTGVVW